MITKVTCKFTVDNVVDGVWYNGISLAITGKINDWQKEKTVSFSTVSSGNGELKIRGTDLNGSNNCVWGGLLLKCQATDPRSPWHNFKSDTVNWKAHDGSPLCNNNAGFVKAGGHIPFIKHLLHSGAQKIWTSHKTVTLIGSPTGGNSISGGGCVFVFLIRWEGTSVQTF